MDADNLSDRNARIRYIFVDFEREKSERGEWEKDWEQKYPDSDDDWEDGDGCDIDGGFNNYAGSEDADHDDLEESGREGKTERRGQKLPV